MNCEKTGIFIAQLRKQAGLTQLQLAEKMGVTNSAVSKWERGLCYPDIELVSKLAELFSVNVNEILIGEQLSELTREAADGITKEGIQYYGEVVQRRASRKMVLAVVAALLTCLALFSVALLLLKEPPVSGFSTTYVEFSEMYHSETTDIGQLLVQYDLNGERRTVVVNLLAEKNSHGLSRIDVLKCQVVESGRWPLDISAYCELNSADQFQVVLTSSAQEREKQHRTTLTEVFEIMCIDGGYLLDRKE